MERLLGIVAGHTFSGAHESAARSSARNHHPPPFQSFNPGTSPGGSASSASSLIAFFKLPPVTPTLLRRRVVDRLVDVASASNLYWIDGGLLASLSALSDQLCVLGLLLFVGGLHPILCSTGKLSCLSRSSLIFHFCSWKNSLCVSLGLMFLLPPHSLKKLIWFWFSAEPCLRDLSQVMFLLTTPSQVVQLPCQPWTKTVAFFPPEVDSANNLLMLQMTDFSTSVCAFHFRPVRTLGFAFFTAWSADFLNLRTILEFSCL